MGGCAGSSQHIDPLRVDLQYGEGYCDAAATFPEVHCEIVHTMAQGIWRTSLMKKLVFADALFLLS